jgi:hypothetical protein
MSRALPEPVERWLALNPPPTERFETAIIEGRARFRRQGKGLWLPIEATMSHQLGQHHVADLRVGFGPLTFVRGLDGYVDGTGFSRISHTLDMGPEIDQSAALFMWAEAILFPAAWHDRPDVEWADGDEHGATVTLPIGEAGLAAQLAFDPGTGLPSRFGAERYKGVGSRPVGWTVDYEDWRPTSDGVVLPGVATVAWADEPGPWFRMWIERANPGADVSEAMARGRALLADVAGNPMGIGPRR